MLGFILSPIGKAVGSVLTVAALVVGVYAYGYQRGRTVEQVAFARKINHENKEAGNAAEDWRARYRRCAERDGLYDFETGACDE
ncbi:hypothetical protein NA8A_00040 [Nitratireductor indicus C115]|uniref:Uncharacterized protein n=1 Tax=Nitratireductor indicus C115 TaxID=1231190 RepID=K2P1W7_9HYPH|nr:hypothetical protein [Nitratireductor indicus]EKF44084.1 hypothetical protein NA8A_00040 [Nitratireductor indicus C115]SFQ22995.1 hypothetical protein SAMN05216176_1023 [Nitratireductor indicus]SFQ73562.1 hypothetical protein SAMN05216176_1123 [Nitratireductor indicus]